MRTPFGKRKTFSIPQSTFDAITKKQRRRIVNASIKMAPIPALAAQNWAYHRKVSKRFMQKISGRAMEQMKIKDPELKKKLHQLAIKGVMAPIEEHAKAKLEIEKLIGKEKTEEFFDRTLEIGDQNIGKIKEY